MSRCRLKTRFCSLKHWFFSYNVTFALYVDSFTWNTFLNHRVILQGLRLEHIIFRHRPTCLVIARLIINSLHVHGSLQLSTCNDSLRLKQPSYCSWSQWWRTWAFSTMLATARQAKTLLASWMAFVSSIQAEIYVFPVWAAAILCSDVR